MPRGGMHHDSRPRTDPFIDQAECSVSFKWDRKQRSKRCQANEGEENMPYEPDRVTAVKRFLDPAFGAGLARHAVVDGVQEYVAVDQDHELVAEGQLAQEILVLEHCSRFEGAVVVDDSTKTHRKRTLTKRACGRGRKPGTDCPIYGFIEAQSLFAHQRVDERLDVGIERDGRPHTANQSIKSTCIMMQPAPYDIFPCGSPTSPATPGPTCTMWRGGLFFADETRRLGVNHTVARCGHHPTCDLGMAQVRSRSHWPDRRRRVRAASCDVDSATRCAD